MAERRRRLGVECVVLDTDLALRSIGPYHIDIRYESGWQLSVM